MKAYRSLSTWRPWALIRCVTRYPFLLFVRLSEVINPPYSGSSRSLAFTDKGDIIDQRSTQWNSRTGCDVGSVLIQQYAVACYGIINPGAPQGVPDHSLVAADHRFSQSIFECINNID